MRLNEFTIAPLRFGGEENRCGVDFSGLAWGDWVGPCAPGQQMPVIGSTSDLPIMLTASDDANG